MTPPPTAGSGPAVVVGGELNALGVCRCLTTANIPTYVVDSRRFNPAMWSRHATPIKASGMHGRAILDTLHLLHARLQERPALIITDEMALLTISEHRGELSGSYRFRLPEHTTVEMLHNKAQFHEYAVAQGFPVPTSEILRAPDDIRRIQRLRFPVVVKPADKRIVHAGKGVRLLVTRDRRTAANTAGELLAATGEVIVQECIEGPDSNIYFCLFYRARGGPTVMWTGRKLASNPPGSGSTAFCTAAREAAEALEPLTHSLLERVEYEGFGGVEYKWDASACRFAIIEPTVGRTDWQEEIATLAGVNIPLAGYYHEYGIRYEPRERDDPIVWQASYIERAKLGSEPIPPGAIVVDGYFRRDDVMPALVHYPKDLVLSAPTIVRSAIGRWVRGRRGRRGRLGTLASGI